MSSLAQQLQRLAVPFTQQVFADDRKRASLLFDPKEAANLDREAVFAIGQCGLEELQNVDPEFQDFEESLFNLSAKNFERSLQTKEVNEQLDVTIRRFLIRLSPYFPLKSSHKALEWLIYRYHIHQYNMDALLLCVLPYHEMKVFVRVLQLLKLDDPADKWHWLNSAATNGVPLARGTLINHCTKDPGFMAFILEMVPAFIKAHGPTSRQLHAIVSLYTCVVLGTLSSGVTERTMSVVVPHLVRGLKSRSVEYKAANYMVLSQLAASHKLQEAFLDSLLPVLAKHIAPELVKEALSCLILIYQTQKISQLPKKCFKYLCRLPGILPLLSDLSAQYTVDGLVSAWTQRLIPAAVSDGASGGGYSSSSDGGAGDDSLYTAGRPQYGALLEHLLDDVQVSSQELKAKITRSILEEVVQQRTAAMDTDAGGDDWSTYTRGLLAALERRYSDVFDATLTSLLSAYKHSPSQLAVLHSVVSLTVTPARYTTVSTAGGATSLVLGLRHAAASVRQLTVSTLGGYLAQHQDTSVAFLEDILVERLQDDDLGVVKMTVKLLKANKNLVSAVKLAPALLTLLQRIKVTPLHSLTLELLVSLSADLPDTDLSLDLLPFVVVLDNKSVRSAKIVVEGCGGQLGEMLAAAKEDWLRLASKLQDSPQKRSKSADKSPKADKRSKSPAPKDPQLASKLNLLVVSSVVKYLDSRDPETLTDLLSTMTQKSLTFPVYKLLTLTVLGDLVVKVKGDARSKVIETIINIIKESNIDQVHKDLRLFPADIHLPGASLTPTLLSHWLTTLASVCHLTLPLSVLLWAGYCVVRALNGLKFQPTDVYLTKGPVAGLVLRFMDALMTTTVHTKKWRPVLLALVDESLPKETTLLLMSKVWVSALDNSGPHSAILHVGSFYLMTHVLQNTTTAPKLADTSPVLVSLLASLLSPVLAVRRAALTAVQALSGTVACHGAILGRVCKRQEEILADAGHTAHVLGKAFAKMEAGPKSPKKSLRPDDLSETLKYLMRWLRDETTPLTLKACVLEMVAEVPSQLVLKYLTPIADDILSLCQSKPADVSPGHVTLLDHVLRRCADPSLADSLTNDSPLMKALLGALNCGIRPDGGDGPQQAAMKQLSRELYRGLPLAVQHTVVTTLLTAATDRCVSAETVNQLTACLRKLRLDGSQVLHELAVTEPQEATVRGRKRSRVKKDEPEVLKSQRVTLLLEVMTSRTKVKDTDKFALALFGLLTRLQKEDEDVEYIKQLTLSCLLNVCGQWSADAKPQIQEIVNIESLVVCIRSSASPQTQQLAMMVMSAIAPLYPEYILHNVMSIFTFMGTNLLPQDDAYSFQLITKTVDTVIPALIEACSDATDREDTLIRDVLRVFVDARHHVPPHRSTTLYRRVVARVGAERHLWRALVLVVESAVRTKDVPAVTADGAQDETLSAIDKDLELAASISANFSVDLQLAAITQILEFLITLTGHLVTSQQQQGKQKKARTPPVPVITVETLSPQQLRLVQYHVTRLVGVILAREQFIAEVLKQSPDGVMDTGLHTQFRDFVHQCLALTTHVAKGHGYYSNTSTGRFWKSVLHKVYDVLDKVNYLLPTSVFLLVVSSLVVHDNASIRRKALDLLNNKLGTVSLETLGQEEVSALLAILPSILRVATEPRAHAAPPGDGSDDTVLQQMALYSLKLLCKLLGAKYPMKFSEMFSVTLSLLCDRTLPLALSSSALLCLAELVSCLRAHALSHLSTFMPQLLRILGDTDALRKHELLLVCSLTALQKVVSTLPNFLSPHLPQIILAVCRIACFVDESPSGAKSQPCVRLRAVRHQVATAVPGRVLIPVLATTLTQLRTDHLGSMGAHKRALVPLFDITREHISALSKDELPSHQVALVALFCDGLDLRNHAGQLSLSAVSDIEDVALRMVLALVLRLSENSFRPMFYKLYDWACREDSDIHRNRQLVFFRLAERLADNLRGLFNLFIGHAIKAACRLLDQNNTKHGDVTYYSFAADGAQKSCLLVQYILGCLHKCFLYDTERLVDKEMFSGLVQPLVDQLENTLGGPASYEQRMSSCVTPCISQLAVAVSDDSSWKVLNYQMMLKARHVSAKVRFATLQTAEALATKLGEEYSSLLPETVPFLAELMEDDSEEVEQRCQEVVTSLEQLLGESIQQYF